LKGDKHGLGLATIREHRLAAQKMVILLILLAHPSPKRARAITWRKVEKEMS
jgi:hypothetical protein